MNESIYKYADVGLIHFMAYPQCIKGEGPIVETITEIANDPYFTFVEITWIKDPAVRKQVKEILTHAGMGIGYGAQPALLTQKLSINSCNPEITAKGMAQIEACIDEAYEMGAKGLGVLAHMYEGDDCKAKQQDILVANLTELCRYSASKGSMPILLETFDRVPYGKNALVGPTCEAVEIAERVKSKCGNFDLMLDLSHLPLLSETAEQCLVTAKDHIGHIHIGNCVMENPDHPANGDEHPRFGIEGGKNGIPELTEFLRVLLKVGYLKPGQPKPVSFEVKPVAAFGETTASVVANSKRALNVAWAMV